VSDEDGAAADLQRAFRSAMARLAAGVCVVAVAAGRHQVAATLTSVVSASLDPPMVLFCVHSEARLREALERADGWAVSILDSRSGADADWLASAGRPQLDQLGHIPHRIGSRSRAALLDRAQAWLECRTVWLRAAGDHDVVVGEVLSAEVAPGERGALVHRLGRLHAVG
jgi:flavin reductase (DIM6/NTAB) family NADH-FMN oxidoreductase RutF